MADGRWISASAVADFDSAGRLYPAEFRLEAPLAVHAFREAIHKLPVISR